MSDMRIPVAMVAHPDGCLELACRRDSGDGWGDSVFYVRFDLC
jgi:hypothetical protein